MLEKLIPLGPTLVVLVGPSGAGKTKWAHDNFAIEEIVSTDGLRQEYLGDFRRFDQRDTIVNEFDRRICNRLEMGLRVVADATHIRATARKRTARLAAKYGAKVVYVVVQRSLMAKINHGGWRNEVMVDGKNLITRHDETFVGQEKSIVTGDGGLARLVVDLRVDNPKIVQPLARNWPGHPIEQAAIADIVSRGYDGVLVVGDVHGNHTGLVKMIKFARRENLFMLFLGDIVDYGTDTLKCADEVGRLVFNGWAASVFANHEKKIHQWATRERKEGVFGNPNGFNGRISHGNLVTMNQLKAMEDKDRFQWETRFIGLCALMPHMVRMPGYTFVHASIGPHMLDSDVYRFAPETAQESFAMYGHTTGEVIKDRPVRTYEWVDTDIPPRMTVVAGHDCRQDQAPLVQTGAAGGRAVFLDTGSSKPDMFEGHGHLSGMVLKITSRRKMGYVLENERFIDERELPT